MESNATLDTNNLDIEDLQSQSSVVKSSEPLVPSSIGQRSSWPHMTDSLLDQIDSKSPSDQTSPDSKDFETSNKIPNQVKIDSNENLTDLGRPNLDSKGLQNLLLSPLKSLDSFDDVSFLEKHRLKDPNLCKWIEDQEPCFRKKLCAELDMEMKRQKSSLDSNSKEGDISLENVWYDLSIAPEIHIDSLPSSHPPETPQVEENAIDSSISSLSEDVKKTNPDRPKKRKGRRTNKNSPKLSPNEREHLSQPKVSNIQKVPKQCEKFCRFGHIKFHPKGCHTRYCNLFHPKLCKNSVNFGQCFNRHCQFHHLQGAKFVPAKSFENNRFVERNEVNEKFDFIIRNLDKFIAIYNISSQIS